MELINPKVENSGATAEGRLAAAEFNNRNDELQNLVKRSGLLLSSGILDAAGAVFLNATKAHSFQDNGVVNAPQLRPISGAAGVKVPEDYTDMEGAEVSFVPAFTNTGPVTVGFGQTANIGNKPATYLDGSPFVGGEIQAGRTAQFTFNGPAQAWRLNPWSLPKGIVGVREFNTTSAYVKPSAVRAVLSIGVGAGAGGAFASTNVGGANAVSAPGGGAGKVDLKLIVFEPAGDDTLDITVGAGGLKGTNPLPNGTAGGETKITFQTTPGISELLAPGGSPSVGGVSLSGFNILMPTPHAPSTGFSIFGGHPGVGTIIGGTSADTAVGGSGGSSFWGTSGIPGIAIPSGTTVDAPAAQGVGGGGGGGASISLTRADPADGSNGFVLLLEIA